MSNPIEELQNPNTPAARLAEIAQQHPELGSQIAAHPNCYDGLRDWIAQYAAPTPAPQQPDPAHQQPQQPEPVAQYAPQQPEPIAQPAPQAVYAPPAGGYQAYGAPTASPQPKKSKTGLFIGIGAGVLVLLLALGGALWWFLGAKVGGSASADAAAKKLVTSVTNMDPLAMYGSLAPSEFSLFETTSQKLLDLQTEEDAQSVQEFIESLNREVSINMTTPLETKTTVLVEGEVERVAFTDGVIEIDGSPEKVAEVVMDHFGPIAQAQSEGMGYPITKDDLDEMRHELETTLRDELPYRFDFAAEKVTLVSVNEPGGWYVSPLMSFTDYAYVDAGGRDSALGSEIVAATEDGASSPDDAATSLTEAVFAGDYDAIVERLPLAERRAVSVYAPGFFDMSGYDPGQMREAVQEFGVSLEEARYTSEQQGDTGRIEIDELSFTSSTEDYLSGGTVETRISISGTCVTMQGERPVDIYSEEYAEHFEDYMKDLSFSGSFSDYMEKHGPGATEPYEESICLAEEVPQLEDLGLSEWRIIAVQENGDWMVSPVATVADISTIIATKVQEAADRGKLNEIFA